MIHHLEGVVLKLVVDGKGILAADETVPSLTKRFATLGIDREEPLHLTRNAFYRVRGQIHQRRHHA